MLSVNQGTADMNQSRHVKRRIRFVRIFAGLERERQTTVGLSKTAFFSAFGRYSLSSESLETRP